jgi:hypothetical protein
MFQRDASAKLLNFVPALVPVAKRSARTTEYRELVDIQESRLSTIVKYEPVGS